MKNSIFLLLLGINVLSHAQQLQSSALTSGGNSSTAGDIIVDQAVGELATWTLSDVDMILSQGVIQPQFSIKTDITPIPSNIYINLYPNPVSEFIYMETNAYFFSQARIIDLMGRNIMNFTLEQDVLKLSGLSRGYYMLGLYDHKERLRYVWRFQKL